MSHTYEKVSGNKAKLSFTIPAEQFDEALQQAFLKLRKRINVPGFRRGKAPRKMIETLYGESVFYDDAFEAVFPDAYREAIREYDLKPVDQPQIELDEIGAGKDLQFHLEVFVRPDVTLGDYKGLSVEADLQEVTDDMVNARIEEDRNKASRTTDVEDRPVQEGDTVNLDYAGSVDGVPFAGGTAEGQTLTIGSHQFIPGFEEQMVGMSLGEEKDLNVRFPDEYHSEELKGKDAVFHVKVNGIQVTEKPELDDDFATDVSEFDTFREYRDSIVSELTKKIDKSNSITIENALVEKASENAQMDIPAAMIEDQADYQVRQMEMRMRYQGLQMEDYLKYTGQTREDLKKMYMPEAEKRVRAELTIEAIRKAESIEPGEEDIEKEIAEQAESMGQDVETFRKGLTDEQKEYLKDSAAIRMVLDLLKKDAKVEPKKAKEPETDGAGEEKKPAKKAAKKPAKKNAEPAAEEEQAAKADDAEAEKPARKSTRSAAKKTEKKDAE